MKPSGAGSPRSAGNNLSIRVADLRKICNVLLDQLQERDHDGIEIFPEHYWKARFVDVQSRQPTVHGLALGSVSRDWQSLQGLLESPARPARGNDLLAVSAILRVADVHLWEGGPPKDRD